MTLENQVVSLELAKKLKELGVKQESLFWWCKGQMSDSFKTNEIDWYPRYGHGGWTNDWLVSAFTVAELGEMLPNKIQYQKNGDPFELWFNTGKNNTGRWMVAYDDDESECEAFHADTEVDARAKCLIYLLENKLISLPA